MNKKFKWPISSSILIDASVSKVWEVISASGNLNGIHPFCKENSVVTWPGEKSKDIILYYSGRELIREFFEWHEGRGYKLMIGRRGGRKTEVHWEINPFEKDRCVLKITLFVPHLQKISALFRWLPHFLYMKPRMKKYLDSVLKGFEYHITTGKPVGRNQFGPHSWFSSKVV